MKRKEMEAWGDMGDAIPEVDEDGEMGEDNNQMGYDDGMDQEYDEHND